MRVLGLNTKLGGQNVQEEGYVERKLEYLTYWYEICRARSYLLLEISPSSVIQNVYKVAPMLVC